MTIRTVLLAGAWLLATAAAAQGVKVGYVNLPRIEKESATAARATEALRREFEPRNQQVAELQKRIAAAQERLEKEKGGLLPAEAQARSREIAGMMRQSDQMVMRLAEDFKQRRNELGARVVEETRAAINAVAEAGKFDLVVQEAAYARSGTDITDQVLKEMAGRGGAAR